MNGLRLKSKRRMKNFLKVKIVILDQIMVVRLTEINLGK